jgi:hypothetical protein
LVVNLIHDRNYLLFFIVMVYGANQTFQPVELVSSLTELQEQILLIQVEKRAKKGGL